MPAEAPKGPTPEQIAAAKEKAKNAIADLASGDIAKIVAACTVLGKSGELEAVEPLVKVLKEAKDSFARGSAANALGSLHACDAVPALIAAFMDKDDLAWVRRRAEQMCRLFDRFRVDHLVGYFRMYVRPRTGGAPHWMPDREPDQIARGEKVLTALVESARARVIAEDLGTIPPFVRASLEKLGVPGYKVMMWEKDGDSFRDPATYPLLSLGTYRVVAELPGFKKYEESNIKLAAGQSAVINVTLSVGQVSESTRRGRASTSERRRSGGQRLHSMPYRYPIS